MPTFAESYLKGHGGSPMKYRKELRNGKLLLEAFFEACSEEDKEKLRGTRFDPSTKRPFGPQLIQAVNYLLDAKA